MRLTKATVRGFTATVLIAIMACGGGGGAGSSNSSTTPTTPTSPTAPVAATPTSVVVQAGAFSPTSLTVSPGTTVKWNWDTCSGGDGYGSGQTCVSHNVTFDTGNENSDTQSSGSFSRTFMSAGTYAYHCTVHGTTMSGKVVVQ